MKYIPPSNLPPFSMTPLKEKDEITDPGATASCPAEPDIDIDLREVYFLIMQFLSDGPCQRTCVQFWSELLEYQLLPRRYHAWYSRSGAESGDEKNNGFSFPLSYNQLVERYPHIEKNHLLKLLKQLILSSVSPSRGMTGGYMPNAADVPTLLGSDSFSLLESERKREDTVLKRPPGHLRWPHMQADQVHGLGLRELGGGFAKHHRAPSIRAACYAVAKPSTMVQKIQHIKKLRGHRNAVYCAIFDQSGRHVITGSDDRLVKIWSMETAFCLASCRGHEGDITDLAVSSNNFLVASASNDFTIRVWHLPDGAPISVLRGHMGSVTAIAFSPRPGCSPHLLSSSDDGTCRIWDARLSQPSLRIYLPKPSDPIAGKSNGPTSSSAPLNHQILCCAYNASGTVFVTGSSDTFARVWNACKSSSNDSEQHIHEMDVLSGHENDVNYVQFSGCAVASRSSTIDSLKEDGASKFKNSWSVYIPIVACLNSRWPFFTYHIIHKADIGMFLRQTLIFMDDVVKIGRWTRAYHLKVPPPPMPPQSSRAGPRQRLLPAPRGVNMIVWSLDNRFVLAAIMDRRICVWNAVDGSLVHSLTGHTESSYVLDVHPFDPRIAMSAGYDGRTIIWDIWEGTPIRIYEIGRFKLVDGKFSPYRRRCTHRTKRLDDLELLPLSPLYLNIRTERDGTSIVLSDDVGQLYTLSTGQGESQKDAKYDQFFLGDYRPLIQDTHGNVLDQETQLVPYRRNIQDLLCDSSMIPYPEPYQSMYQKRRLAALGIDWIPSSVKLAIGPADISGFQEYQILPLIDLDSMIEPMPQFIDWEPEIEIQSDDNDSEYNIADELSSEGEQGCNGNVLFDDPECSAEESDFDYSQKDGFRRSKRKRHREDVDFASSSGRLIKKRNLNECGASLPLTTKTRKSRKKKATMKKSSKSKSLRPQRAAARNARNMISQFSGDSEDEDEDEDEDESEFNSSDNESSVSILKNQSESDISMQNMQHKTGRGVETSIDDCDDISKPLELPESHLNTGNRKKLILKLPIRDSSKFVALGKSGAQLGEQVSLQDSFEAPLETTVINRKHLSFQELASSSGGKNDIIPFKEYDGAKTGEKEHLRQQSGNVQAHLEFGEEHKDDKIRWGDVKVRTSKRLILGDPSTVDAGPDSTASINYYSGIPYRSVENLKVRCEDRVESPVSLTIKHEVMAYKVEEQMRVGTSLDMEDARNEERVSECIKESLLTDQVLEDDYRERKGASLVTSDWNLTKGNKDQPGPSEYIDHVPAIEVDVVVANQKMPLVCSYKHNTEEVRPRVTKLRFKTKLIGEVSGSSSKVDSVTAVESWKSWESNLISRCSSGEHNINLESSEENGSPRRISADLGEQNGLQKSEVKFYRSSRLSSLQDSKLTADSNSKTYDVFDKWSKFSKAKYYSEVDGDNHDSNPRMGFLEASVDGRRTRSMGMRDDTREQYMDNKIFKARESHGSVETSNDFDKFSLNSREQRLCEPWRSSAVPSVGLRSARTKRVNYGDSHITPRDKRKLPHLMKNVSWLMLSEHDVGLRYIPQKGDNVVYIRQGHQQFGECHSSSDIWAPLWEKLRAVESCKVTGLSYSTYPGSGESCCKISLEFVDPSCCLSGKTFKLTLPELNDFPDFLVERTLYDSSIKRNWTTRDKCVVWWKNEQGGGSWWPGRIVSVKPKSVEFPDCPWEKYSIRYKNDSGEEFKHCPWELLDPDANWEHPCIEEQSRAKLVSLIAKLEHSGDRSRDRYGIKKLTQISWKQDFLNRFPVPLSFDVIHSRLVNKYYRNLESVEHDFMVMISNARSYIGENAEFKIFVAPKVIPGSGFLIGDGGANMSEAGSVVKPTGMYR
ncbi:hypothetical protein IFM89_000665 [Coptis chinensis]|uniref:Bromo domain-containing protein n=1 Tax=Coptis chinensis TaxID=261450 RepID=A0A835II34_9MAGN|nr:hypothetical protein IFM89_000665 [Coptis chinensis]